MSINRGMVKENVVHLYNGIFSSVQSLNRVRLFATPWIAARQASLSITNSQSSLKLMSIESVMPSSHLILCQPLLLLPPIPPSIRVFSNESTLCMRWPKYWSFSFSISPSMNTQDWSPLGWTGIGYRVINEAKLNKDKYPPVRVGTQSSEGSVLPKPSPSLSIGWKC